MRRGQLHLKLHLRGPARTPCGRSELYLLHRLTQPQDQNAQAAVDLQRWVSSFAVERRPAAKGTEVFGEYWSDGMVQR